MELRQLRYVEAVARHLNFTRAAEELYVAQPALSHQVKQLEVELGVRLFDRGTRHVVLTDAGRAVLPFAQHVLADVEAIRQTVRDTAELDRGLVQLGAQQSVTASGALPGLLVDFRTRYPGVDVVVHEESVEDALTLLQDRRLDLALAQFESHHESPALVAEPLYEEELALVVAPGDPLLDTVRTVADLGSATFLAFNATAALHRMLVRICAEAGFRPRIGYQSPTLGSIRAMAAAGHGVALLPIPSIAVPGPQVRQLSVGPLPSRVISLVRGRDHHRSHAARALAVELERQLSGRLRSGEDQARGSGTGPQICLP